MTQTKGYVLFMKKEKYDFWFCCQKRKRHTVLYVDKYSLLQRFDKKRFELKFLKIKTRIL